MAIYRNLLLLAFFPGPVLAQQAAPKPSLQQLLDSAFELKAVIRGTAPCGNQSPQEACAREFYYLQSPKKDVLYRCELGVWDNQLRTQCNRV